jgi:hypothetical protein
MSAELAPLASTWFSRKSGFSVRVGTVMLLTADTDGSSRWMIGGRPTAPGAAGR